MHLLKHSSTYLCKLFGHLVEFRFTSPFALVFVEFRFAFPFAFVFEHFLTFGFEHFWTFGFEHFWICFSGSLTFATTLFMCFDQFDLLLNVISQWLHLTSPLRLLLWWEFICDFKFSSRWNDFSQISQVGCPSLISGNVELHHLTSAKHKISLGWYFLKWFFKFHSLLNDRLQSGCGQSALLLFFSWTGICLIRLCDRVKHFRQIIHWFDSDCKMKNHKETTIESSHINVESVDLRKMHFFSLQHNISIENWARCFS